MSRLAFRRSKHDFGHIGHAQLLPFSGIASGNLFCYPVGVLILKKEPCVSNVAGDSGPWTDLWRVRANSEQTFICADPESRKILIVIKRHERLKLLGLIWVPPLLDGFVEAHGSVTPNLSWVYWNLCLKLSKDMYKLTLYTLKSFRWKSCMKSGLKLW